MLATEAVASAFVPGSHASTFGGSPFITAAALAAMTALIEEELPERAAKVGGYFLARLRDLVGRHPFVKAARGKGLILALELTRPAKPIVDRCLQRGLLILTAGDQVLRFVPPLIIGEPEVDEALSIVDTVLAQESR
jgi:acetylornithine/succinyldiaminopimelate/putrescine aminotransferase